MVNIFLVAFTHSHIHSYIASMGSTSSLRRGAQYLAQGHFGIQVGKTGIKLPTFWLEDDCSTPKPQLPVLKHFYMCCTGITVESISWALNQRGVNDISPILQEDQIKRRQLFYPSFKTHIFFYIGVMVWRKYPMNVFQQNNNSLGWNIFKSPYITLSHWMLFIWLKYQSQPYSKMEDIPNMTVKIKKYDFKYH